MFSGLEKKRRAPFSVVMKAGFVPSLSNDVAAFFARYSLLKYEDIYFQQMQDIRSFLGGRKPIKEKDTDKENKAMPPKRFKRRSAVVEEELPPTKRSKPVKIGDGVSAAYPSGDSSDQERPSSSKSRRKSRRIICSGKQLARLWELICLVFNLDDEEYVEQPKENKKKSSPLKVSPKEKVLGHSTSSTLSFRPRRPFNNLFHPLPRSSIQKRNRKHPQLSPPHWI